MSKRKKKIDQSELEKLVQAWESIARVFREQQSKASMLIDSEEIGSYARDRHLSDERAHGCTAFGVETCLNDLRALLLTGEVTARVKSPDVYPQTRALLDAAAKANNGALEAKNARALESLGVVLEAGLAGLPPRDRSELKPGECYADESTPAE